MLFLGLALGSLIFWGWFFIKVRSLRRFGENILAQAEKERQEKKEEILKTAHDEKRNFVRDLERQKERQEKKERLFKQEVSDWELEKKAFLKRSQQLEINEKKLREEELKTLALLERSSHLSQEEAKVEWFSYFEKECLLEKKRFLVHLEEEKEDLARKILIDAMQQMAIPSLSETTLQVVRLPSSDFRGRIIGREGRNARLFEKLTGVTLTLEEETLAVLSSFDPERLFIAKAALTTLIQSGKIFPARIEEAIEKATFELKNSLPEWGKAAALEVGVVSLHPELTGLLGKLKLRTSSGQNILQHCKETAALAGLLAEEMGLKSELARRIGLLHEIEEALPLESGVVKNSSWLAKKYGESETVAQGIAYLKSTAYLKGPSNLGSLEAEIAGIAKTLSSDRPGARSSSLASYMERMQRLEEIAKEFPEVTEAHALRGGRELFVAVRSLGIGDEEMRMLARKIAFLIEKELDYHGKIKVVVSRESQAVQYAI